MGFGPTQLALVELESTPLDHSGKLSVKVLKDHVCNDESSFLLILEGSAVVPKSRGSSVLGSKLAG